MQLSLPLGCTKEVKDLFKKQTMLLRAVETVDSGNSEFFSSILTTTEPEFSLLLKLKGESSPGQP
jgi:hypothetical protein